MTKTITKDMLINEVLDVDPALAVFFMQMGMHCVGCPSAAAESVEEACAVHGQDPDVILEQINAYLASK